MYKGSNKVVAVVVFHEEIQRNLEGESSSLSEVTWGFLPGNPSFTIIMHM